MWFGSDLQKIGFHLVFLLFRLPEISLDTIWICQKSDVGRQSDQGHSTLLVNTVERLAATEPHVSLQTRGDEDQKQSKKNRANIGSVNTQLFITHPADHLKSDNMSVLCTHFESTSG